MKLLLGCLAVAVAVASCKTVVTTTTEVRPSRYAVVEFTRALPADSVLAYARRAAEAEGLKIQRVDRSTGSVVAGPVQYAASNDLPALEALVTIAAIASGPETRVRITASSAVEVNETGGLDARLAELVQRVQKRFDLLAGH